MVWLMANPNGCLLAYLTILLLLCYPTGGLDAKEEISAVTVKWWAQLIEIDLKNIADFFSRKTLAKQAFADATLELRNDSQMAEDIMESISTMMNMKVEAVKRIVEIAEQTAQAAKDEEVTSTYQYYNAKCLTNESSADLEPCSNLTSILDLTPNPHFWNLSVNTRHSAVHVPTNVFDRSRDVLKAIKWSEELDATFRKNFNDDPSLSWQYFGSSTGFMRQYPATEWKMYPLDIYDCRTRAWYIEAATSPKDVVILVDHSGSMTGVRKEIARHVVDDILDTLGNNDYVNILKFSEYTTEVVECFENRLVQANLANIRSFKQGLEDMKTEHIANFSLALEKAFELLASYRDDERDDQFRGASCNQAIMLITDGVPYNYEEIFKYYNWALNTPVRVFTYLVGREVPDVREIKWMACANRGYYVHLSTQAEVREQVLQYVPVMARPLVLTKTNHPIIWTPVYADLIDPKMTDWLWEKKEFAVQKRVMVEARILKEKKRKIFKLVPQNVEQMKIYTEVDPLFKQEYRLMTSVSIPVFDKRDYANLTERVLLNEAVWVDQTREILWINENVETLNKIPVNTRVANLLGVAGTDIPISDIKKLTEPFKLGVGGYAFIVTNNGYVLYHPDLRAEYHGILKPNYNSLDFVEIEVVDDDEMRLPREFNHELVAIRRKVINQDPAGNSSDFRVIYHLDDMRRGGTMIRKYHYVPIRNSPFTLVVAIPVKYGSYRVNNSIEIKRFMLEEEKKVKDWFVGRSWRLHPDWVYCKYANESNFAFLNELQLCHFLGRTQKPGWKWPNITVPNAAPNRSAGLAKELYYCDRDLLQSVVYDAKKTMWFLDDLAKGNNTLKELKDRFGITSTFIATRSGLTRWQNFSSNLNGSDYVSFGDMYPRAIDEIWYRRAVDFYYINSDAYVYSVPFDSGNTSDILVTVSHAIFVEHGAARAPAAVVGFQFQYKALRELFFNKTSTCEDKKCGCGSEDFWCYILDDNGYVVVSENILDTGRFFGVVKPNVMQHLIDMRLYKRVRFFDYQGVCFKLKGAPVITSSCNNRPVHFVVFFFKWLLNNLLWLGSHIGLSEAQIQAGIELVDDGNQTYYSEESEDKHQINKTRPESCDQEVHFYTLQFDRIDDVANAAKGDCDRPFFLQPLQHTNLILVIVNTLCPETENSFVDIEPFEIDSYNNTQICHKYASNNLFRRRPTKCINYHGNETEIVMCGEGSRLSVSYCLVIFTFFLAHVTKTLSLRLQRPVILHSI